MTIAVIFARKDGIYAIADTLSRGASDYSLNTQKLFYSTKHRLLMCFAGEGNLKPIGGASSLDQCLYVDFIIKDFFSHLDANYAKFDVAGFQEELKKFLNEKYAEYADAFFSRLQDGVEYFYGGFSGDDSAPSIFCHKILKNSDGTAYAVHDVQTFFAENSKEAVYFSNTNAVEYAIASTLKSEGAPVGMTAKKLIEDCTTTFTTSTIPLACLQMNTELPHIVGPILHLVKISKDSTEDFSSVYEYNFTDGSINITDHTNNSVTAITKILSYRSYADSNKAFLEGKFLKYLVSTGERIIPIAENQIVSSLGNISLNLKAKKLLPTSQLSSSYTHKALLWLAAGMGVSALAVCASEVLSNSKINAKLKI